jgi:hypothetical protein
MVLYINPTIIFKIESGSLWDLKNNCEWANKSPLRVIKAPKRKNSGQHVRESLCQEEMT